MIELGLSSYGAKEGQNQKIYLFVYGSLKKNETNYAKYMQGKVEFIGEALIKASLYYSQSRHLFMMKNECRENSVVFGELYLTTEFHLIELDELEKNFIFRNGDSDYIRIEVEAFTLPDHSRFFPVHTYEYTRFHQSDILDMVFYPEGKVPSS